MKIEAVVIDSRNKKRSQRILIDSGSGPLEARISKVLPGMKVLGVFFYPSLEEISIHVCKETI